MSCRVIVASHTPAKLRRVLDLLGDGDAFVVFNGPGREPRADLVVANDPAWRDVGMYAEAAKRSAEEHLIFLNDDVVHVAPGALPWLERHVCLAELAGIQHNLSSYVVDRARLPRGSARHAARSFLRTHAFAAHREAFLEAIAHVEARGGGAQSFEKRTLSLFRSVCMAPDPRWICDSNTAPFLIEPRAG